MEKLVVVVVRKRRRYIAFFIQKMVYCRSIRMLLSKPHTKLGKRQQVVCIVTAENKKRRQKPLLASLWHIELQSIHMITGRLFCCLHYSTHSTIIRPSLRGRQGQHLAHNFELQTTQFSSDIQSEQTYTTNQVKLQKVIQVKFNIPTHQSQEPTLCLRHLRLH